MATRHKSLDTQQRTAESNKEAFRMKKNKLQDNVGLIQAKKSKVQQKKLHA